MYFVLPKPLKNSPKTTFAVTTIFSAPPSPYRTPAVADAPRRRTVSSPPLLPIAVAAFGSSWVKKGDGGLGLRWWWLRV